MKRWEYYVMRGSFEHDKPRGQQFLEDLNGMGRQGWEVVGIVGDLAVGTVLLKRAIPDD